MAQRATRTRIESYDSGEAPPSRVRIATEESDRATCPTVIAFGFGHAAMHGDAGPH